MKLISMTDFALYYAGNMTYKDHSEKCTKYAKFLKQPLTLGMFIPCDLEGNVLEEPKICCSGRDCGCMGMPYNYISTEELEEYYQAEESVLFDGFTYDGYNVKLPDGQILDINKMKSLVIENIIIHDLTLTQTAIKQLGL